MNIQCSKFLNIFFAVAILVKISAGKPENTYEI